jgi:NAD(P)H-dependent FMN reductase
MKVLAISGSARSSSTNTAMLRAVAEIGRPAHDVTVFCDLAAIPVFSPDLENERLPDAVSAFVDMIGQNDGLIIASPEYVRSIPGGLKNAIDWLVSRDEIINKPIALMHASHRGDDMLDQLRIVLSTVSANFCQDLFLRFPLMKLPPEDIQRMLCEPANREAVSSFLLDFAAFSAR